MYLFGNRERHLSMADNYFDLPEIITLEEFGGNFSAFQEAVYQIFKQDFVDSKPIYKGKRLGLKKYPLIEGLEYTFYHFTHDGDIEIERIPNLRRYERIAWPKPIIEDSGHPYLKIWQNHRKGKTRILIFHEGEDYLVVLEDRGNYILPWTAYLVTTNHRKETLMKEYEAYIKANAAQ